VELWIPASLLIVMTLLRPVLTNSIDCIVILLATWAILSFTSPGMASTGIVKSYSQLRPTVFICETVVIYNGKPVDLRQKLAKAI